jgi:hypothetical protein
MANFIFAFPTLDVFLKANQQFILIILSMALGYLIRSMRDD